MRRTLSVFALALACEPTQAPSRPPSVRPGAEIVGTATPVDPGETLSERVPELPPDEIVTGEERVGRAPRRLDVGQLQSAYASVLGLAWIAPRPPSPGASPDDDLSPTVDLFDFFGETLGRPDYVRVTERSLEPSITFAKLANDAARTLCREAVTRDLSLPPAQRKIYLRASPEHTLANAPDAVRANISALALRFWALDLAPDAPALAPQVELFRLATQRSTATSADGWRAVCIDLATDPRFLTF